MAPPRIIRQQEVEARTGRGRTQIWNDIKNGTFPPSIPLGPRAKGWLESDIDAWIEVRVRESRDQQAALAAKKVRDPNRWMKRTAAPDQAEKKAA